MHFSISLPASKGKTCPEFSLSTNKFFCVKIAVLFLLIFGFHYYSAMSTLCLPFPLSYRPITSFLYHHILSLLSSVVPFPLLRFAV